MGLSDNVLKNISKALDQGQFDADLSGDVFKQRLARSGGGKSGGYRLIICFHRGS
ncbi:MAG: type II toxin-antitoxin system RelE/ParE family toxin [Deltaproteobacteria bacterium]|jgi:hypothetical protein|nr:type II toxin-antitoxin system RelE/ParE family toxin [Deltaproteobacteria bacterium]